MSKGIISAVSNYKGGTGKTTTSVNLSAAIALKGKRVLLIDGDPQSDSSRALLSTGTQINKSLYDVLAAPEKVVDPTEYIYKTIHPNLLILPNITETSGLEIPMAQQFPESNTFLRSAIREYAKEKFDYTFIDCPPTLSIFVNNNLYASDMLIVPMDAGSGNSLEGIKGVLDLMNAIREDGYDLNLLKILINRVDRRKGAHTANIEDAKERFGAKNVFKSTIPTSSHIQTNESLRSSTLFTSAPSSKGAQAFRTLCKEFLTHTEGA
ncbi:MAG: ParA family protein [Desulfatitalea sp.]|nr:ParA family protein [Desulfatitalea sp.]NNJ99006.1 ParA family protein [Desulfatitalea sp.]